MTRFTDSAGFVVTSPDGTREVVSPSGVLLPHAEDPLAVTPGAPVPAAAHGVEATPDAFGDGAAFATVEAMPAQTLDGRRGSLPVPFPRAPGTAAPSADLAVYTTRTTVDLNRLLATQAGVDRAKVLLYLSAGSAQRVSALEEREVPLVAQLPDGTLAIVDGHHRLSAARWAGVKLATVDLYTGPIASVET